MNSAPLQSRNYIDLVRFMSGLLKSSRIPFEIMKRT